MASNTKHVYSELYPSNALDDFVALYFEAKNLSDEPHELTICPDGYFKLIIQVLDGEIIRCFHTGFWSNEFETAIPPNVISYGIKFKIIAPEYIMKREIKSMFNSFEQLSPDYWGINTIKFGSFKGVVAQLENILLGRLESQKQIQSNRIRLSQFLYSNYETIQAKEVANQIYWSQREINRYLNKYIGISLKKYLNIQKCYRAYLQIMEGEFYPEKGFFDQAHFIREIKKHTGKTPTVLYRGRNDQFIQLNGIKKL